MTPKTPLPHRCTAATDARTRPSGGVRLARAAAGLLLAALLPTAQALPMGSEGRWMLMADVMPEGLEIGANHAVSRRDAFGVWAARSDASTPGGVVHRRDRLAASYTRLVQRWNLPDAQANLWFVGLAGTADVHDAGRRQGFWSPAVLADYETTRVYTGAGLRTERSSRWQRDEAYLKAGFSFYEVDYEETQPWLLLEVKRKRDGVDGRPAMTEDRVTPMLRLINRFWFLEVGGNRDGVRLNLMWSR
jgi:hypothetical protein